MLATVSLFSLMLTNFSGRKVFLELSMIVCISGYLWTDTVFGAAYPVMVHWFSLYCFWFSTDAYRQSTKRKTTDLSKRAKMR